MPDKTSLLPARQCYDPHYWQVHGCYKWGVCEQNNQQKIGILVTAPGNYHCSTANITVISISTECSALELYFVYQTIVLEAGVGPASLYFQQWILG